MRRASGPVLMLRAELRADCANVARQTDRLKTNYSIDDSTLEGCGTLQPLRSVAEYVVPHAMFL